MVEVVDFAPGDANRACILIINWNGRENLRSCLDSCAAEDYPYFDVVVVDNASTDGSVEMIEAGYPQVRILKNRVNLGFTGAGNAGMKFAVERGYRYVLLLANDIILDSRCLSQAIKCAEQTPAVGMIGFHLLGAFSYVPVEELGKASAQWNILEAENTDWVEGAAFVIDPGLFVRLGGYDDLLFMYGDENDLENRIRRAGYLLKRINVPAWHNAGRNVMGEKKLRAAFYSLRNTLIILVKENPCRKAFRSYLRFIRAACDPRVRIPDDQIILKRYRPSNVLINGLVVLAAIVSFLWNVPRLARTKRLHSELVRAERERKLRTVEEPNERVAN